MNTPLDNAITAAAAAEATYQSDVSNVQTIQTAIDAAELPLDGAKATLAQDAAAYNKTLDDLIQAASDAKIKLP